MRLYATFCAGLTGAGAYMLSFAPYGWAGGGICCGFCIIMCLVVIEDILVNE